MTEQMGQQDGLDPELALEAPELSDEDIELLTEGSSALQAALSDDPDLMADVEQAVSEILKRGITPTTLGEIAVALEILIGTQASDYLVRVAIRYDESTYIEHVKAYAGPEIWRSIRRLLAVHGADLYETFMQAGEPLDTWRGLNRFALYDAITGSWKMTIEINTYGGESIRLTEAPESLLRLMLGLAATLNSVPAEVASTLVDEGAVRDFFAECLTLISLYAPSLAGEPLMDEPEGDGDGTWWQRLLQRMTMPPSGPP